MSQLADHEDSKSRVEMVEALSNASDDKINTGDGTINLFHDGSMVLVPTPSADPKDPLNLPIWHKSLIIFLVGAYSAIGVLGTSGLGAVMPSVFQAYPNDDPARVTDLVTYPTLFMGIGNLVSMPLTLTIGRRPVFLFSLILLVVTGIWCAFSTSLSSHIAGRNFFSMAAGQSEALAPFIVEEIHFLHERSSKLSWFIGVQTVGTAAMFVMTAYVVPPLGLKWWYLILTFLSLGTLILSIFFVVETMYDRNVVEEDGPSSECKPAAGERRTLRPDIFGERTLRHDLKVFHHKPVWSRMVDFYIDTAKGFFIPTIFWILLFNGAFLGVYIYQASTFATILTMPPYNFAFDLLGWVQIFQIAVVMVLIPGLGYGTDLITKYLSRKQGGVFKPEFRLISLIIPTVMTVLGCVIYGQTGAHPTEYHWMGIAAPFHMCYLGFLTGNLIGITYAIDAFPEKAGARLMVICVGRGFISFGLSYSTVPAIEATGYDGAMNILAGIVGGLMLLGIPMYILGPRIRKWSVKTLWPALAEKN
ncbi:major facilitator superfamily transporter [Emericellopsis atlantica]|uniref:Major facilitator superfamily transporter n=1 Tax=Emericellopsis atlantica TaxID=2614577 RepID=A0A9P7ZFK9_9HYPO|nr:major facilitator superfamily transporter [Emericellopsis atlantica]KAG9250806.1 major facilitator superfamily transporter [Emericellopsis atlantica]